MEKDGPAGSLTNSRAFYQNLFETSADSIFVIDKRTLQILDVNAAACRLYGYSKEELLGMKSTGVSAEPEKTSAAVRQEKVKVPLRLHRRKDGTIFPVEIAGGYFSEGGREYHTAFIRDMTERQQVETDIREREKKFRSLFEAMVEGVALHEIVRNAGGTPVDYRIIDANPAFFKQTGIPLEKALGRLGSALYESTPPPFFREYVRVAETGLPVTFETFFPPLDRHFAISVFSPGRDRFATVFEDVTIKKRMEDQLQQSQKLESLGVLAGGIAHDFNNLLGGMFGYVDLAMIKSRDENITAFLVKAMGAIERARGLTQQLLTFSKGGFPVRKQGPFFPLVREVAQFALSGSTVSCSFDVPQDLWEGNFDPNQISQAIDNIVMNAQQAMPLGGIISISARNMEVGENKVSSLTAGGYVKISIRDSGIGIPPDILPRIFDPFFSTKQKGSGLGLSTCFSILKRHHGCITVESEPGAGTVFHLWLPASREAVAAREAAADALHRGSGVILLMDDEEIIREAMGEMFAELGYSVVSKNEGKETLGFFAAETGAGRSFAAIFLDLTVPGGMGGKETAEAIRKMDSNVPIFICSGYAEDPVMAEPARYGITGSICKPFTLSSLSVLLQKHMGDGPSAGPRL